MPARDRVATPRSRARRRAAPSKSWSSTSARRTRPRTAWPRRRAPRRRVSCKVDPLIGYLHRGIEKMAENRTYLQIVPLTDRLDYVGSMYANWAYCRAVERLAGIRVPERAEYLRVIVCELQRIASHMMGIGSAAADTGAFIDVHLHLRPARTHHRAVRGPVRRSADLQLRAARRRELRRAGGLVRRSARASPRGCRPDSPSWTRSSSAT